MLVCGLVLLLPLIDTPCVEGASLRLATDGRSEYSICVSDGASPSERHAAEELQKFVEEMSGARLPVISEAESSGGPLVLVGRSRFTDRMKPNIPFEKLGPEGFVLRTSGRHLVIAGGRQRGTMYGVYTLLDKLGCCWFARDSSRIPRMPTIDIPSLNETQQPAFEYREPFFTEAFDKDWAARNRTNGAHSLLDESVGGKIQYHPFVHSFYSMIPPAKHFKDHPEYFSLIDGKRRWERGQLCLTNPDVLKLGVEAVLGWIQEHPEATILSVSQNDWTGWCECDRCAQVEREEGGAHSGPILRYVNALAEEVEKRHPDKLIDTLAYWYTEPPPLKARPRRNVRIRLCPIGVCQAHPYEKCDRSLYFVKNLQAWSKITSQLYIWHYNTNFSHYLLPFPDFDELAADIPMYRRMGVVGLFMEGAYAEGGGGENAELRSYVMARQLWDPTIDVGKTADEFLDGYYGRAGRIMREYFDLLHAQVRTPPAGRGEHLWIFIHPGSSFLDGDFLGRAAVILSRAEEAAENETTKSRVRKARLSVDYVELSRARAFSEGGGAYAPARLEELRNRFRKFMADVRRFGINSLHEGRPLKDDETEFEARMRSYPALRLENEALRALLVPELSGRVVQLVDKGAGKDVLRAADPGERNYPDVSGLGVFVYPDIHGRALRVDWRVEGSPSASEVRLAGSCENGLVVRRLLRLAGNSLRSETVVENPTAKPVPVALQARVDYSPGKTNDARLALAYRSRSGATIDKALFEPGLETSGSENCDGENIPDGEWHAYHRGQDIRLVNRFPRDQVTRCSAGWSLRGENRITLTLWSPERALSPGEQLRLNADYVVTGREGK